MQNSTDPQSIANNARGSIDPELLAGVGPGGLLSTGHFADQSLAERLTRGERLLYCLTNHSRGVEIEWETGSDEIVPGKDYRSAALITDRRIVFVIGQESGDRVFEVPYSRINDAKATSGILKRQLTVDSTDATFRMYTRRGEDTTAVASVIASIAAETASRKDVDSEPVASETPAEPSEEPTPEVTPDESDLDSEAPPVWSSNPSKASPEELPTDSEPGDEIQSDEKSADQRPDKDEQATQESHTDEQSGQEVESEPAGIEPDEKLNTDEPVDEPSEEIEEPGRDDTDRDDLEREDTESDDEQTPELTDDALDDGSVETSLTDSESEVKYPQFPGVTATESVSENVIEIIEAAHHQLGDAPDPAREQDLVRAHIKLCTALDELGSTDAKIVAQINDAANDIEHRLQPHQPPASETDTDTEPDAIEEVYIEEPDEKSESTEETGTPSNNGSVEIHVIAASGEPVSNALVSLGNDSKQLSTTTDVTGRSVLALSGEHPTGPAALSVEHPDFASVSRLVSLQPGSVYEVGLDQESDNESPNEGSPDSRDTVAANNAGSLGNVSLPDSGPEAKTTSSGGNGRISEAEVIAEIQRLTQSLGHPPTTSEMSEHGSMSPSPAYRYFDSWSDALAEADATSTQNVGHGGVSTQDTQSTSTAEANAAADQGSGTRMPPSNELAELYEAFGRFQALLSEFADQISADDRHPAQRWYTAVHEHWGGSGPEGAPSYGRQQHNRNNKSINDYRSAYGDEVSITEFQHVNLGPLDHQARSFLGESPAREEAIVPIAPESNTPLPVLVENESSLDEAVSLLGEFPTYPDGDMPPTAETTTTNKPSGGRLDSIEVTVLECEVDPVDRRDADLLVLTPDGRRVVFEIWSKHGIDYDWVVGEQYRLEQAREDVWETGSGQQSKLSSTRDLRITLLENNSTNETVQQSLTDNTNRNEDQLDNLSSNQEEERNDESTDREKEDTADDDETSKGKSTLVDSLMKDIDL